MSESFWSELETFLEGGGVFSDTPNLPGEYLEEYETVSTCEKCGSALEHRQMPYGERMVCQGCSHERRIRPSDAADFRLNTEKVLTEVCSLLDLEVADTSEDTLPGYVIANTKSGVRVAMVCDPQYYDETLDAVFTDSVKNQRINAVFSPIKFEGETWERAINYPLGSLAPPFTLEMLSDPDAVREIIESAQYTNQRSELALSLQGMDDGLHEILNQNPRLIQSELSYTRIFRETSFSGNLGERLETVTKAALMTLDIPLVPTFGGTSGVNETDIAARVPGPSRRSGEPVLALVDSKSNAEADIGSEAIVQKHANYLRQSNSPAFDEYHTAHVFVVNSMKGSVANEIEWYDAIRDQLKDEVYGSDTTMVVLFTSALAQMVDAHLSVAQRNQLNLSVEDLSEVLYPFFNHRRFKSQTPLEVREMTRKDADQPTKTEEEYISEYRQREQLLVITPEMVDTYLREVMDDDDLDFVEHELNAYPSKWY